MKRRYNLISFWSCFVCLLLTLYSVYAYSQQLWSITTPKLLLVLTILTFSLGVIGFKENNNWLNRTRSWITVILSFVLMMVLSLVVVASLLFQEAKQHIKTTQSPDQNYTIDIYRTNGGAATSFGVKAELDGPLWFKKTIYSNYNMYDAHVKWVNEEVVSINTHELNLRKGETYRD